jgi:predicted RND superfamily exporter protein
MQQFAHLVMRFRLVVLVAIAVITLFFLYVQRNLAIQYVDIFPPDHPNSQLQRFMVKTFGGTSAVLVAMEVTEGEIFEPKNLDKLNRVQTAVKNMGGVVPFRIYSIVSPKFARVDAGFDEFGVPEIRAE